MQKREPAPTAHGSLQTFEGALRIAYIPVRVANELREHEHWRRRHARSKMQHAIVAAWLAPAKRPALPCTVRLTRIGRGQMDSDGAVASLKYVRDAVAKWFGVNDSPTSPLQFEYAPQERGDYAVRIEVIAP